MLPRPSPSLPTARTPKHLRAHLPQAKRLAGLSLRKPAARAGLSPCPSQESTSILIRSCQLGFLSMVRGLMLAPPAASHSPGEPYSCRGRRHTLGITSISVFTYCRIVPCSCRTGSLHQSPATTVLEAVGRAGPAQRVFTNTQGDEQDPESWARKGDPIHGKQATFTRVTLQDSGNAHSKTQLSLRVACGRQGRQL